jgi:type IV secretory pathway TrbD component
MSGLEIAALIMGIGVYLVFGIVIWQMMKEKP